MKLRSELLLLSVVSLIPLVIFALIAGTVVVNHQRATFQQDALGRVASAMIAIDAEIHGSVMALQALAASTNLEAGDLRTFHDEAARVLATRPNWLNVGLTSVDRVQLVDARLPFGRPAPFASDDDTLGLIRATSVGRS